MVLCPKEGSLVFTPPADEMSEVVSHCFPHRQLWVSNLSKIATQWLEVDLNLQPYGCMAQNIPLHHHVPYNSKGLTSDDVVERDQIVSVSQPSLHLIHQRIGIAESSTII